MRTLLVLLAFGVMSVWLASRAEPLPGDFIAAELDAAGVPGVAYATVDGGEIVSGAHGVADLRTREAVTPGTPFQIASISKSFTAVAILQLVEAGDVDLDAEVSLYLATFRDTPAGAITIRQLLSHTSGYSTKQGNSAQVARAGSEDALSRQVEKIAQWSPAYATGSRWDYSNANYIVLGAVIEAVSGLKYDRYVETNILEPIGMSDSFVSDGGTYDSVAVGHTPWFGGKRPVGGMETATYRAGAPAGGVISTADDLALYLAVLLNGEDDIISAASKALMMQPASGQSPYYGLGWALSPQDGSVYHAGTAPGTETFAIMVPAEGKAVVVLVNAGSGMGFGETGNLTRAIIARGLGRDFVRDRGSWGRKSLFLMFALMPVLFVAGMVQAWLGRSGLRTKSGVSGAFSLWFPLLMTAVLAWVSVFLIPSLFGTSLGHLWKFSPDFSIVLAATAVSGLLWAVFRLCVYYLGGSFATEARNS